MHQLIVNRASLCPSGPSVLIPHVLSGLPALGHEVLVAKHSGAFHHLRKPEHAASLQKRDFHNYLFCRTVPAPPAYSPACSAQLSVHPSDAHGPMGARAILSIPVHPTGLQE